jgi:hypothetical protein
MKQITIFFALLLSACASTMPKTVKVPVPVSCPKPVMPTPPIDYMADLNINSSPSEFVKASLATRLSYKAAYEHCVSSLEVYQQKS